MDSIETFLWSPDSSRIAFVAKKEETSHFSKDTNLVDEVDSYAKKHPISHLFLIKAQPSLQIPEILTPSAYNIVGEIDFHTILEAYDWSPDNKTIAFTYTPEVGPDSRWKNSQIALVDIHSKNIQPLPKVAPHQSIPKFSPDGKHLAFLKSDEHASYSLTRHLTLYSLSDGLFKDLPKTPDESPFLVGPSILG